MTFQAHGLPSGIMGGIFPFLYEVPLPMYVTVQEYTPRTGRWSDRGLYVLAEGTSTLTFDETGGSYWYFKYSWMSPWGPWVSAAEYAGGGPGLGWYQWGGYATQGWCSS